MIAYECRFLKKWSYLSLPVVSTLPLRRDLLMCVSSLRSNGLEKIEGK